MAKSRLVDRYGNPIELNVLTESIGRPTLTGIRSVWAQTPIAGNLTPTRLAQILIDADTNEPRYYLTLAEEMEEREPHYASVLGTRKRAISGLPVSVEAASDDAGDVKLADAVRELTRAPAFGDMVDDALDALGKGYSAVEIMWNRGAQWTIDRYERIDPRFFRFDMETLSQLRLLDDEHIMGTPLPPYKFIVHKPKLKSGLPVRGGLARLASAAYLCKAFTLTDWMAFAEVFGMPLRLGRYGPNPTQEDINTLITAVANIGTDAAAILPDSMRIEFQEAAKASGGDKLFLALADWLDRQTSKAVLGQTSTSDAQSVGLGSNTASVHDEVRGDILASDARQLENTLNRDLVRPYIDLNYGPQKAYPRVCLPIVEPEDLALLADALQKLVPLGLRVGVSTVRDKFGLPDPDDDEDVLKPAATPAAPAAAAPPPAANSAASVRAAIAAGVRQALNAAQAKVPTADDIDALADAALADWEPLIGPLVDPIQQLAENAATPEEFKAGLAKLIEQTDAGALIQSIATATFKARGLGDATDNPAA